MLFQPRVTSSSARFVPTIPAPIMTMLGVDAMWFLLLIFVWWLCGFGCCYLPEHDGAGPIQQHAVLAVPAYGAGQGQCLRVLANR